MEYKLKKDQVTITEVAYDSFTELPIECDLLLPDYCPDIVKVLKCQANPVFSKTEINGDKCHLEGSAAVRVFYSGEDGKLRCSEHKVDFYKTLELKEPIENPAIFYSVKEDYLNCKAVNQRRVDVRGAFTISVKILSQRLQEMISEAEGGGIQLNRKPVRTDQLAGKTQKRFSVREEMQLPENLPAMEYLIRHEETASVTDWQMTAGKVIIKGQLDVLLEYQPVDEQTPATARFSLPISQMMDLDETPEEASCFVSFRVTGASLHPQTDLDGVIRFVSGDFSLKASCTVLREQMILPVTDAYSTQYELSLMQKQSSMLLHVQGVPQTFSVQESASLPEEFSDITDFWCETGAVSVLPSEQEIALGGKLRFCLFGKDEEGMPVYFERAKELDLRFPLSAAAAQYCTDLEMISENLTYQYDENGKVQCRCDLRLDGLILGVIPVTAAYDIAVDESREKTRDTQSAMTIYYADAGESIWNIAKRYNTSIAAVMEENNLEKEILPQKQIVLIPLVG